MAVIMFNSEAKQHKILGLRIHTSGHGYWIPVYHFDTRAAAVKFMQEKKLDPNHYKVCW
jgi:hypothetical protein